MAAGSSPAAARVSALKPGARAGPGTESLQRRMKVGAANDRLEREADRIADHVVGPSALPTAAPPPIISPISVQRNVIDDERDTGPEQPTAQLKAGPEKPAQEDDLSKALGNETAQRAVTPAANAKPSADEIDKTAKSGNGGSSKTVQRAMRNAGPEARKGEDDLSKALNAQRAANAAGASGGTAPAGVESSITAMRSGSAPGLDPPLRSRMENSMGVDLGGVRVHSGASAGNAADSLNARAFTVGQDMFFGRGQYDPVSTGGQRLIAHETAHTVQQRGGSAGVQRIQRADKDTVKTDGKNENTKETLKEVQLGEAKITLDSVGKSPGTFIIPKLLVPTVDGVGKGFASGLKFQPASKNGQPLTSKDYKLTPPGPRPSGKASDIWSKHAKVNFADAAKAKLKTLTQKPDVEALSGEGDNKVFAVYVKKGKVGADAIMLGTVQQLSQHDNILRPQFSQKGIPYSMQADHILEWQLGGSFAADNMQMLLGSFNMKVGSQTDTDILASITAVLNALKKWQAKKENKDAKFTKSIPEDARSIKSNWVLHFNKIEKKKSPSTSIYWARDQIKKGEQVDQLKAMTAKEMIAFGFKPSEKGGQLRFINVFPDLSGGKVAQFKVKGKGDNPTLQPPGFFYRGIHVKEITDFKSPAEGNTNQVIAKIKVSHSLSKKKKKKFGFDAIDVDLDLNHHESLGYGSYIKREDITKKYEAALSAQAMSPIKLRGTRIEPGGDLVADGEIVATKFLFPGLRVPLRLVGDEIFIDFPIPAKNLKFGPINVTDPSIRVGVSKGEMFLAGQAGVEIDKVGAGILFAKATRDDIEIGGKFNFNFDFVEKAELDAKYSLKQDAFAIKGTMTVKKGSLPGVNSGTIEVNVTNESFGLTGSLQLGGVLTGSTITVGYTPKTGLLIEGKDLPLPVDRLPGVSNAKVTMRAQRSPDTGEWLLSGAGSAALAAPGATGTLTIAVKGNQVYFDGLINLSKGPASGFIQVTATNLQMDENGKPVEGGAVGPLQIWGKGQASIAFGKILTGTAGIEYTKEGKIIISGEIALPPTVDLFDRVDYSKNLLKVEPPDFPIWGVKLGPVGIGIFAFVDARLDFIAYVGPGQLRNTKVKGVMDLDKPSEATVEGDAQFYVPAYAGFKLDLGGGLKAQVAVAYVKGRVGLDGTLGLGVEGKLDVGVKWNPTDGIAFNANANVKASPKFELGVNASVTAGVDLPWPLSDIDHTWGPWRKKLGEFGPNMELSADFPVGWSEKNGLDFDINKIKVTKPKLDAKGMMKSAFDTLV